MLEKIAGFFANATVAMYVRIGAYALAAAVVGYLVYTIHHAGVADEQIRQLKATLEQSQIAYGELQKQAEKDKIALSTDRDRTLTIATESGVKIDEINKTKASDNGPIRAVTSNALDWVRKRSVNHH